MKIAKTPNAKKAAFLAAILVGTPVATSVLLTGCDTSTNPNTNTGPQTPAKEYEDVEAPDDWAGWKVFIIKKEKGINFAPEIQGKLKSALVAARGETIVFNYLYDADKVIKNKVTILIDNSGTEPSLSTDGIHLPLTYLEDVVPGFFSAKLVELVTSLSSLSMKAKQVGEQAKEMFYANNRAARQQRELIAKYTGSKVRKS